MLKEDPYLTANLISLVQMVKYQLNSDKLFLFQPSCTGTETLLSGCGLTFSPDPTCDHQKDVGLACIGKKVSLQKILLLYAYAFTLMNVESTQQLDIIIAFLGVHGPGSTRFHNGAAPNDGNLQVRERGSWFYVCTEGFDEAIARVVCREMGYTEFVRFHQFPGASNPQYITKARCSGTLYAKHANLYVLCFANLPLGVVVFIWY